MNTGVVQILKSLLVVLVGLWYLGSWSVLVETCSPVFDGCCEHLDGQSRCWFTLSIAMTSPDAPAGASGGAQSPGSEVTRRYGRLKTIFKRRVASAKDTLKATNVATMQLTDIRQDLRQIVDELKACHLESPDDCTDFGQCDTEAEPVLSRLADKIESQTRARDRDRLKLSEFKTPQFDGDVGEYLSFKAEFYDIVGNRASDRVALLKLREEALKKGSTAYKSVAGCSTLSDAFHALDSLYGDSELQRNALLVRLRELPSVTRLTDASGLRNIVTTLETIIRKLDLIQDGDLLDSATFSALMVKLPGRVRRDIDEKIYDCGMRKTEKNFRFSSTCVRGMPYSPSHITTELKRIILQARRRQALTALCMLT